MKAVAKILRAGGYVLVAEGEVLKEAFYAIGRIRRLGLVAGAAEVADAAMEPLVRGTDILFGPEPTAAQLEAGARVAAAEGRRLVHLPSEGQLWANKEGRRDITLVLAATADPAFEGDVAAEALRVRRHIAEENGRSVSTTASELAAFARHEEENIRDGIAAMRAAAFRTLAAAA